MNTLIFDTFKNVTSFHPNVFTYHVHFLNVLIELFIYYYFLLHIYLSRNSCLADGLVRACVSWSTLLPALCVCVYVCVYVCMLVAIRQGNMVMCLNSTMQIMLVYIVIRSWKTGLNVSAVRRFIWPSPISLCMMGEVQIHSL